MNRFPLASLLLVAQVSVVAAFSSTFLNTNKIISRRASTNLFAQLSTAVPAKLKLIEVATRIRSNEGLFAIAPEAQIELKQAISELEAVSNPPSEEDYNKYFEGDWTLVCTIAASSNPFGGKSAKLPFLGEIQVPDFVQQLRKSVNDRLVVTQSIKSATRIDHVLEIAPADYFSDIIPSPPEVLDSLSSLNLNPLEVSQGKVTLIHKSNVESVTPVLRTRLGLASIVLTVAGTSQYLEPNGADLFGLNLPLGEFLNAGSFDTTYMDREVRISRGKIGLVDQLRVFTRSSSSEQIDDEQENETAGTTLPEVDEAESSVEDGQVIISDVEETDLSAAAVENEIATDLNGTENLTKDDSVESMFASLEDELAEQDPSAEAEENESATDRNGNENVIEDDSVESMFASLEDELAEQAPDKESTQEDNTDTED